MTEFVSGPPGQYVTLPNFRVCARQKVPAKCFNILFGYLTPLENSWHVKSGEDSLISLKDPIVGNPFVKYFWPYCSVKLCKKAWKSKNLI